ncbi:MAG: sugar transferase [Roseovarius sp.]|nr:sugar transferase [Roseovarius sp.]
MTETLFRDGTLKAVSAQDAHGSGRMSGFVITGPDVGAPKGTRTGTGARDTERRGGWYVEHGKRILDFAFVTLTLPISLPIIAICAIALWLEGGQPFYWQQRIGRGGRLFSIVKLRTMSRDAEAALARHLAADPALRAEWERTQKLKNDPRITRVGAVLRKTSLDELPQLWNVAIGEMSIVGPRPMMPDQLSLYTNPRPYFRMRPGITGEWQVSDRNENSFAHRSTVDARYFAGLSLTGDIKILFQTVGVVLRQTGY